MNETNEKNNEFSQSSELSKNLGLMETLTIGIGVMIGAGIFILPRFAIDTAGPGAVIAYILAGLVAVIAAISTSELATGMPKSGGLYYYISRAMGTFLGTVSGFSLWLALTFAVAFYLKGFGEYLALFIPVNDTILALLAAVFFFFINYIGTKESGKTQNVITGALLIILFGFVAWGGMNINTNNLTPFLPEGVSPILPTTALVFVSFIGFAEIAAVGEEVKDPGYVMPRALIGSVIIPTIIYIFVLLVTAGIINYSEIINFEVPLVEAASQFAGGIGGAVITFGALLATASSANASILSSTRINFALGRDEILPRSLNDIHEKYHTPYKSILLTAILIPLLIFFDLELLSKTAGILTLLNYGLINIVVIAMRLAPPENYKPSFQSPACPLLQITGLICCIIIFIMSGLAGQLSTLALILVSVIWYFAWGRKSDKISAVTKDISWKEVLTGKNFFSIPAPVKDGTAGTPAVSKISEGKSMEEEFMEKENYHVLTPMANPEHEIPLLKVSTAIVESSPLEGKISTLNVIEVPKQAPLDVGDLKHRVMEKKLKVRKEMQKLAAEFGEKHNVNINPRILYGRRKYDTIYQEAAREDIDFMVLGWHGSMSIGHIYRSMVKRLVRHVPCSVGVLKNKGLDKLNKILIPFGGGPHSRLGVALAQKIVMGHEGDKKVTILRVLGPRGNKEKEIEKVRSDLKDIILPEVNLKIKIIKTQKIVEGIINYTKENQQDLIIMGASNEWTFKNFLFGSIPDIIAEEAPCSVLMLRGYDRQVSQEIKEKVEDKKEVSEEPEDI